MLYSGKTLAYLVPICHKIIQKSEYETSVGVQAVVLVPTKELVAQVYNVVQDYMDYDFSQEQPKKGFIELPVINS